MKQFIEITTTEGDFVLVNINHIFKVCTAKSRCDEYTQICLIAKGYNQWPYQVIDTKSSYDEVKKLIEEAI